MDYILIFAILGTGLSTVLAADNVIHIRGKNFNRDGTGSIPIVSQTAPNYYGQCLDHFGPSACATSWQQRYFVNWNYYKTNGPIFFMLGAEQSADGMVDYFEWQRYATTYGAVLVCLEHRYYGESIPTNDTSVPSLMRYFNSQQALGDGAKFIGDFKYYMGLTQAKTVVFGGSYGGNLAAWFRQKYPGSANLAVSSSGPLEAKFDFQEYLRTVSEVIYYNNANCFTTIRDTFTCIENLIYGYSCSNTRTTSKSNIPRALQQCWSVNFDVQTQKENFFLWMVRNMWASNYPWTNGESKCNSLLANQNGNDILANYGQFLRAQNQSQNCAVEETESKSHTQKTLEFINSKEGVTSGAAGWFWQTCNEFGYYQTADLMYQEFGRDITTLTDVQSCQQQYGSMFTADYIQKRINQTNTYYKGRNNDGSCIIFVNGAYDPWHPLGITKQSETSSSNFVVYIPKAEHCQDMTPYNKNDQSKSDTIAAQKVISDQIGKYLNDPNCS